MARLSELDEHKQDERYNPSSETGRDMYRQEHEAIAGYDRSSDGLDDHPISAGDASGKPGELSTTKNIDNVNDLEQSGGGWKNSVTGAGTQKISLKGVFKKKGPIGLIIAIFFGGAVGIGGFFGGPSLLIVNFAEVLTNKFNTQLGSMEVRTNKVLTAKMNGTTSGVCSTKISIRCKYGTLSDRQVKKFQAAGIEIEESGKTVIRDRTKPAKMTFTDSKGNRISVTPQEFPKAYASNAEFRTALKKAYAPKLAGFADKRFAAFAGKNRLSKKAPFNEGDDDKKRAATVQERTKNGTDTSSGKHITQDKDGKFVDENGNPAVDKDGKPITTQAQADAVNAGSKGAGAIATDAEKVAKTGIKSASSQLLGKVGNAVGVLGAAGDACSVYGMINAVSYGAKTIRSGQMKQFAMMALTMASMTKATKARPGDVNFFGNMLTKTTTNNPKSATDSFGYQYAAGTRTGPIDKPATEYLAGGGLGGDLAGVTSAVVGLLSPTHSTKQVKDTCRIVSNPFVQVGSLLAGIALWIIPGGQAIQASKLVGQGIFAAVTFAATLVLPALLADMVAGVLVDNNTAGEAAGNAITSGASSMMGGVANEGGNAPMHPDQAMAYNNLQQTVLAQNASDDRLTANPLDATNSSTFMGQVATKLIPYTTKFASVSGIMSSTTSLIGSSFAAIASPLTKAASADDYKQCQDLDYRDLNLATDPFCNPIYGVPPQYLSDDPITIMDRLGSQIDEDTGEPAAGSDYAKFAENCIGRTAPIGDGGQDFDTSKDGHDCFIDTQMKADYYVHSIDQRVLDGMEEGYTSETTETSPDVTDPTQAPGPVSKDGWTFPTTAGAPLVSPFGPRGGGYHTGVDLGVPSGSPFYATRDGVVTTREYNVYTVLGDGGAWCPVLGSLTDPNQKDIWIKSTVDGKTYTSVYAHMSKYLKKTGDVVKAGDMIGYTGGSGCSSGPHVHFEIWQSDSPTPSQPGPGLLDPWPLISP